MADPFVPRAAGPWPCSTFLARGPTYLVAYRGPSVCEGHVDGAERRIVAFDLEARALRLLLEPETTVERFIVSDDGRRFAAVTIRGHVHVWDSTTLELVGTWAPFRKSDLVGDLPQVLLSPGGDWLVAVRVQRGVIIPEAIVRIALDRAPSTTKAVLPSDQIALAELERPASIVKVEPEAAGVWLTHHRQPGVVRMAFGSRASRRLLQKHVVRWAVPMNGPRLVFSSPEGEWRLAEAVPGGRPRVTRLAVRPDVLLAWAASPSGDRFASIDEECNLVVRSTSPVRKLVTVRVPAPEITAFHAALCIRDDGVVWTLDAEGKVHRVGGEGAVTTVAPELV